MLVDDAEEMRLLLRTMLTLDNRFLVVGEAADGAEALDVVAGVDPDLVLLDIDMPRLDGIATLPRLREVSPRSGIVMLSGYSADQMEGPSLAGGAIGYFEKGLDLTDLPAQLHTLATVLEMVQNVLDETYRSELRSASLARKDLRSALTAKADATVVDVVELLTTELVTNAVKHAQSEPRVTVAIAAGRLRVAVTDDGPGMPVLDGSMDLEAEGGRGLHLVRMLAASSGVVARQPGKTVWFELDL